MFIWKCPKCERENRLEDSRYCTNWSVCGYEVDLLEARCIHGMAYDMACDDCGRSGFRFEGINMPEDMEPVERVAQEILDELSADGPGFTCERMKGKTMAEEEWRREHDPHVEQNNDSQYEKVYNLHQPPSYRLYSLICPCGASLQCMEELEGVD